MHPAVNQKRLETEPPMTSIFLGPMPMAELLHPDSAGYVRPPGSWARAAERAPIAAAPPTFSETMATFIVDGGQPLSGSIRPAGNKNAALPAICAAVLTPEPVTLDNVPRIRDVETLLEILESLGADVSWTGDNTVT